jgi:hypothetical protein
VVVLTFQFKLVTNQVRKFALSFDLELVEDLFEESINLFLNMSCFGVDFLDFEINFRQIFCELILATFNVGIDFLDLGRNFGVSILELDECMLSHLPSHMIAKDFAINTQSFGTDTAIKLKILFFVFFTLTKDFRFFRNGYSLMLTGQLGAMVVNIALGTEVSFLSDAVKLGEFRRHLGAVLTVRGFDNELLVRIDREIHQVHGQDLVVLVHDVLVLVQLDVLFFVVKIN